MSAELNISREECEAILTNWGTPDVKRLARAHLELLDKLEEAGDFDKLAAATDKLQLQCDELRSQKAALESKVAELERYSKIREDRISGLMVESADRAEKIRDLVPDHMKMWAPLDAVRVVCSERAALESQLAEAHHALKVCMDQLHSQTAGYKAARKTIDAAEALRAKPTVD